MPFVFTLKFPGKTYMSPVRFVFKLISGFETSFGFFKAMNEFIKLCEMFSRCFFFVKNMLKNLDEQKQK